ncbi:MAG: putative zinc-binding metallopeptidase [Polyangiaceae bacterium]
MPARSGPKTGRQPSWVRLNDDELLKLRFCDLKLDLNESPLSERVQRLHDELEARGIRFKPHCWLSSEWFSPDGVPGVAIPFYLAHPRLAALEERQILDVEGGNPRWCMQLLRHEAGHALDTAFRIHRKKKWRDVFGSYSAPYSKFYQPKPYSKSYVLHLDMWYAQSHPAEDWAETFAVWLDPASRWRKRYRGWRAFKKLQYVDELMRELAGTTALVRCRERVESLSTLKTTLREHYDQKKARYGLEHPSFYDRDLRRLFPPVEEGQPSRSAAAFLRRIRPELRRRIARWTGEYQYTIDQLFGEMIYRCEELDIRHTRDDDEAKQDALMMLTVQTMNYLHAGHHRLAR